MKINKIHLDNYIQELLIESSSHLNNGDSIKDKFIRLNTYLLSKSHNKDLLITLQARKELPGLLRSVLYYAVNQYKPQPASRELPQVGNLVYYDKKVFKVTGLQDDIAILADIVDPRCKSSTPLESLIRIEDTTYSPPRGRTIDFGLLDSRAIAANYLTYHDWTQELQKKFLKKAPAEQEGAASNNKILVVTTNEREVGEILRELHSVPFQFCQHSPSVTSASCASFKPLADVYTTFELSNIGSIISNKYKEIIIIGDRNCSKHLTDLIKLRNRGIIDRFVLIGTESPETNFPFVEWHWTKEEISLLGTKDLHGEIRFKLTTPYTYENIDNGVSILKEHIHIIKSCLEEAYYKYNQVRLDKVYYIINEYLRYILPPGNASKVAQEFLQKLNATTREFLEGEDFKDLFYERGVYSQQTIATVATQLLNAFNALNAFFYNYSPKYLQVSSSLKNHEDLDQYTGGRHIITHNSLLNEVRQIPELHNKEYRVGAAPLFSRNEYKGFNHFVESDLNLSSTQFIFPFILNRSQYETMLEANGDVKLYLYEDLEDFKLQKIREAYERKFLQKISHTDRISLTDSRYIVPEEASNEVANTVTGSGNEAILSELAKKFYNLKDHDQSFYENLFEVDDVEYDRERKDYIPQDQTEYTITFTDTETLNTVGFRRVILVEKEGEQENLVQIPVNQVKTGNIIIVYRNQQKEILYNILLEKDNSGVMKEIEKASRLWVSTLREILRRENEDITVLEELLKEKSVYLNFNTLLSYTCNDRKFPKNVQTLEAIRQLALDYNLSANYFTTNEQLQNALKRKAQYHSLSITLGKGVSDEVTQYYFTGKKGNILENLDPEIVEVLKHNIKRGTVKAIEVKK